MNKLTSVLLLTLFLVTVRCEKSSGQHQDATTPTLTDVFPKPASIASSSENFRIDSNTKIFAADGLSRLAEYLTGKLKEESGIALATVKQKPAKGNVVTLEIKSDAELGDEGYSLVISKNESKISANKPAGIFYGIQTFRQLVPLKSQISSSKSKAEIPGGTIRDYPQYEFRGAMLDIARHFFGVDDIKRFIDQVAFYKMNIMHLHLSDDQGWRIEIKSWPNLTTVGGSTQVGGGQGGFLTQEQYKDIVNYASERFVTIIPEIDMPGHTNAALASYAELNCDGKATKPYSGIEVGFSTLCTKKEITYKFLDDVIRELSEITPGPYIHVGGDESHATKKEDYIPFVSRVQDIVAAHNKQMIGWEETAQSKLKSNTIVQHWSNATYPLQAVQQGVKIIMSPAKKTYLDMKYDSNTKIGLDWAAKIEIDSAYLWDPATRVKGITKDNVVGVEAPLWTETITTMDEIEYMVFPRIIGLAEVAWTPASNRGWEDYKTRLGRHASRLKAMGIDYYKSSQIKWLE